MSQSQICLVIIVFFLGISTIYAKEIVQQAVTQSISTDQIKGYDNYPPAVKKLISNALNLTKQNLTYLYGSADPKNGGMDCSGTVFYILKASNINEVPRQSSEIYKWTWQYGKFYPVNSNKFNSFEFSKLKPGDILFWSGTYNVQGDPPISHVMFYLGKDFQDHPLMVGSSDGRTYKGKRMWGVSIFDFQLPNQHTSARFLGYSCIPNLTCGLENNHLGMAAPEHNSK